MSYKSRGACGDVFLVFLEADFSRQFAMKIVDKKSFTSTIIAPSATTSGVLRNSANDFLSEVNILKQLQHPCIIHVHEVFDYPDRLYLVLERAIGGELFDRVVKKDGLDEFTAKLYFYQMLLAIEYLHSKNVVHRDLKPENILLASEADMTLIKVTDFGLSKLVGEQSLMKTLCGTPNYLAPEIIKTSGMGHYNSKVDSWSLGVILFIMLAAYPPFSDDYNDMPLVEQIKKARFSFADHAWKSVSKEAKNLISKMIVVNAAKRFNCTQALRHNWLKDEVMVKQAEELMRKDIDTRDATAKKPSSEDVNASVMQNISHESEADLLNNTVQLKKTDSCKENANLTVANVSEKDIAWKLEEDSSESCSGAKKAKVDMLN
ncbi:myosin light chain kinase A-like [Symsagittifera roscoffensis]|uniref:myosin light chain kinase A-like n=1 Tax=Symsagittifera roscoffensis TaxID=84072 RepID=UPI00307B4FB0